MSADPKQRHILIAGPTASGKSALALHLAEKTGALIVNTDALQVYACWQILTARPPAEDLARADHALYGHVVYEAAYSVGDWLRECAALVAENRRLIFVGGTGLYFRALTQGLADIPATPPEIRAEGDAMLAANGPAPFRAYLAKHDPALYARMDQNNPARLQRAWEVHQATGRPLSTWQGETGPALVDETNSKKLVLTSDPNWLRERIDARFDDMVNAGAMEECRAVLPDWQPALPASRALGAREFMAVLRGEKALEDAIAEAKIATHQYAKRQRTWFRSNMCGWHQVESEKLAMKDELKRITSMA